MRNLIGWMALTGLVLSVLAPPAAAQELSGGVLGGLGFASFANADYDTNRRIALRAGGFAVMKLSSSWGGRVEAAYAMKGVEAGGGAVTVALDYIEVPVLAEYWIGTGGTVPVIFTGPAVGFKVVSKLQGDGGSLDYGDSVPDVDFGWVLGGGLETSFGDLPVLLDARYTRGFRSVFDFGPDDSDSDDKNSVISVGVAVTLF